jgi:hypothetical protein
MTHSAPAQCAVSHRRHASRCASASLGPNVWSMQITVKQPVHSRNTYIGKTRKERVLYASIWMCALSGVLNHKHPHTTDMISSYIGAADAMCPITLSYVHELAQPVAFASDSSQPYELAPLWKWVLANNRHPLTGRVCAVGDITALRFSDEYCSRARDTSAVLNGMRLTSRKTQVCAEIMRRLNRRS